MNMNNESADGYALRGILHEMGFDIHRIETHATDPGCPDIYIFRDPIHCWIETKSDDVRPNKVHYRPKQSVWLESHARKGGLCLTIQFIRKAKQFIFIPGNQSYAAEESLKTFLAYDRDTLRCFLQFLFPPNEILFPKKG
jgi:hypothetical protein